MGQNESKQIRSILDNNYKSLRRFYSPLYGQLTLLQHKTTLTQYALIEKTPIKTTKQISEYIKQRQNKPHKYLLKLSESYNCDLSVCSDVKIWFFLVEFAGLSLGEQIQKRQLTGKGFGVDQIWFILLQMVEIVIFLLELQNPEIGQKNNFYISTDIFSYNNRNHSLKTLEPFLKIDLEIYETSKFHLTSDKKQLYLSPQSLNLLHRGDKFKAKQSCYTQSSSVFTLGMCFMECIMLIDMSVAYEETGINFQRIAEFATEVNNLYGESLFELTSAMLFKEEKNRMSLNEVWTFLKSKGNKPKEKRK